MSEKDFGRWRSDLDAELRQFGSQRENGSANFHWTRANRRPMGTERQRELRRRRKRREKRLKAEVRAARKQKKKRA